MASPRPGLTLIVSGAILLGLAGLWIVVGLVDLAIIYANTASDAPETQQVAIQYLLPLVVVAGLPAMIGGLMLRVGLKRRRRARAET